MNILKRLVFTLVVVFGMFSFGQGVEANTTGSWAVGTFNLPHITYPVKWSVLASSLDGTHLLAAATNGSVFISNIFQENDGGPSWSAQLLGDRPYSSGAVSSDGSHLVLVAPDGYVSFSTYATDIYESIWATRNTYDTSSGGKIWTSVAASSDGSHVVASDLHYIYTSIDSGGTWTNNGKSSGNNGWRSVASSSDGSRLVAVGDNGDGNGKISTSSDSGATWVARTGAGSHNWKFVASSSDGSHLAAIDCGHFVGVSFDTNATDCTKSAGGYVWESSDFGNAWTNHGGSSGSHTWVGLASSADGLKLTAAAWDGGIWQSKDGGSTWINISPGLYNWVSIASSADGNHLIAAESSGSIWRWRPAPSVTTQSVSGITTSSATINATLTSFSDYGSANTISVDYGKGIGYGYTKPH